MAPRMDRMARANANLDFVHVEVSSAPVKQFVTEILGIPSVPYAAIFDPDADGLTQAASVKNAKLFADFEKMVRSYDQ